MKTKTSHFLRAGALVPTLLAAGLFGGCGSGADAASGSTAAGADADVAGTAPAQSSPATAAVDRPQPAADFEGTMQQVIISLGPDAIRSVAGSNDLATVLALSPDKVIEAVHSGAIEADSIQKSILEIDGRMARLQVEGDASYTILDGEQLAAYVVDTESRMIITMDPAKLAAAAAARGQDTTLVDSDVETVGKREIRGFDAVGHRFEFMGDNIATAWLSEELESQIGPIFDVLRDVNPLGRIDVGDGAPVRTVMVNRKTLASGGGFMPAYTITEFYDLQAGDVADGRFGLPDGYQRMGMADLGRGAP